MTPVGALALVAVLCCLRNWQARFPWLLGCTLTLPITAVVVLPGIRFTAFFLVALVLSVLLAWSWARGRTTLFSWPGGYAMLALLGWVAFGSLAGPTVWSGITVLASRADLNGQPGPVALQYSGSNVAQPAYLTLSALVICFLASRHRLSPHVLLPGLAGCMGLSTWRLVADKTGLPFPRSLIDSGAYTYIDGTPGGGYRLRGVFTEPSTLAHYAIATLALCVVMLYTRQRFRGAYAALGVLCLVNIAFAQSGTGVVGGIAVLGTTAALLGVRAARTGRGLATLSVTGCVAVVAVLVFFPAIQTYVADVVENKVNSSSYFYRTSADSFSLRLLLDTFGMGVGLGSTGSSSLWPALLSTIGIIGTGLFAYLVVSLCWRAMRTQDGVGYAVVVASLIITKSIAGSFLSEPLLMLALACCAQAAAHGRLARDTGASEHPTSSPVAPPSINGARRAGSDDPGLRASAATARASNGTHRA